MNFVGYNILIQMNIDIMITVSESSDENLYSYVWNFIRLILF